MYLMSLRETKDDKIVHNDIVIVTKPCQSGGTLKEAAKDGQTPPMMLSGSPREMKMT